MDTRGKIVEFGTALERIRTTRSAVVSGYFDPLLAQHARRLHEIRGDFDRLVVVLANPPQPILPAHARAQLVAALEMVDYVVLPRQSRPATETPGIAWFHEQAADIMLFEQLVQRVHQRCRQPAAH